MSCFDKGEYKFLKACAKEDNLNRVAIEYSGSNYNGISIVYTSPRDGLRMINVAVSYCSPEDEFKPKHGKYQALSKFYRDESICMPLGNRSLEEIEDILINTFLIY